MSEEEKQRLQAWVREILVATYGDTQAVRTYVSTLDYEKVSRMNPNELADDFEASVIEEA